MGTRMMGSHGGGGGNGGIQHPKSDGLSKQGLLYNLTLDEVQHQLGDLGKPLSSMNLDELLKSVYTAESEAYQGMPGGSGLLASGSYMADLSKKTVDELWQDIQGQKKKDINISDSNCHNLDKKSTHEKEQGTLGEMTLEDFLAKAGIVAKSASVVESESIALTPQQNSNPQIAQWIQYQIPPAQQQQHVFMPGHHQVQQPMSPSPLMGSLSDTQAPGRKRVASGDVMEKTVERRQKRMIKNRESAARSRARKQAYTNELEYKVSRLEEENERLKREQEAEKALPCAPLPEPKYQLRRTSSAHI